MGPGLAVVLTVIAGGLVALQAPLNSELARATGSLPAATVNFAVGTAALLAVVAVIGQLDGVRGVSRVTWYYLLGGGLVGAIYVTTVLVAVRSLGAGGVTAATITGQLALSLLIDRLGVLGLTERPLSGQRVVAVVLVALGTYLFVSDRAPDV